MQEIRFHGRGGQGAVIASRVLAQALFLEGRYAQSFPTFGAERRGAPVAAFVRTDERFINLRSQVTEPDYVVVMAARLIDAVPVTAGLKPRGRILINTDRSAAELKAGNQDLAKLADETLITVNLNQIALTYGLGTRIMPLINAPVLGALAKISGLVKVESLEAALADFIPQRLEDNRRALREAYQSTTG